jgi:hypothetical protein
MLRLVVFFFGRPFFRGLSPARPITPEFCASRFTPGFNFAALPALKIPTGYSHYRYAAYGRDFFRIAA